MRIRVVRCGECGWVLADQCAHWSMDCPRARKKKKAHHKLKRSEPGYDIFVTEQDHEYEPSDDSPVDPDVMKYFHYNVPNDMCYADCTCGLPWGFHMPWRQGDQRYVGSWKPRPDGEAVLVPAQASLLVTCASGCGFMGAAAS